MQTFIFSYKTAPTGPQPGTRDAQTITGAFQDRGPPQNELFGATEAYAENLSPWCVQVRSGQVQIQVQVQVRSGQE